MNPYPRTIASVTTRESAPDDPHLTLAEFIEWSKAEHERMLAEVQRQLEEHFAARLAQSERDIHGDSQH